jgi:hypothetical protein
MLEKLWTYVPPVPETAAKYEELRRLEEGVFQVSRAIHKQIMQHMAAQYKEPSLPAYQGTPSDFQRVRQYTFALAEGILRLAPDCEDKTTALREARLARMLLNEALCTARLELFIAGENAALHARMWACSAIALDGVV